MLCYLQSTPSIETASVGQTTGSHEFIAQEDYLSHAFVWIEGEAVRFEHQRIIGKTAVPIGVLIKAYKKFESGVRNALQRRIKQPARWNNDKRALRHRDSTFFIRRFPRPRFTQIFRSR